MCSSVTIGRSLLNSTRFSVSVIVLGDRDLYGAMACLVKTIGEVGEGVGVAITYGSETWLLTMGLIRRLRATQRVLDTAMLGVSLCDQIKK
ncbi:jg1249 [Pararge aegeria aegeria]|uniref:Jg1249 protein n=1 Tax=Pararge aegeria aegeria TaxID=348720 RepID=A0A8S4R7U3_9NEOP|nr:jg1249 [Pararge aegeria aegeria]